MARSSCFMMNSSIPARCPRALRRPSTRGSQRCSPAAALRAACCCGWACGRPRPLSCWKRWSFRATAQRCWVSLKPPAQWSTCSTCRRLCWARICAHRTRSSANDVAPASVCSPCPHPLKPVMPCVRGLYLQSATLIVMACGSCWKASKAPGLSAPATVQLAFRRTSSSSSVSMGGSAWCRLRQIWFLGGSGIGLRRSWGWSHGSWARRASTTVWRVVSWAPRSSPPRPVRIVPHAL
mmetsp:Transcript_17701/g.51664  ORF Transcript_17701/g.51664 Transcript_17701/m.51664 type:complete len:237 (-) Transcript_17701:2880-3590(-)